MQQNTEIKHFVYGFFEKDGEIDFDRIPTPQELAGGKIPEGFRFTSAKIQVILYDETITSYRHIKDVIETEVTDEVSYKNNLAKIRRLAKKDHGTDFKGVKVDSRWYDRWDRG